MHIARPGFWIVDLDRKAAVWMLVAMVLAVRQALDYRSTRRAIAVCVPGWAVALAVSITLGLALSRPVS